MDFFGRIRRYERAHYFIRTRSTGTPAEFAGKLGISKSQCHSMVKDLKVYFKAPVYYSRKECTYCYKSDVIFKIGFDPV